MAAKENLLKFCSQLKSPLIEPIFCLKILNLKLESLQPEAKCWENHLSLYIKQWTNSEKPTYDSANNWQAVAPTNCRFLVFNFQPAVAFCESRWCLLVPPPPPPPPSLSPVAWSKFYWLCAKLHLIASASSSSSTDMRTWSASWPVCARLSVCVGAAFKWLLRWNSRANNKHTNEHTYAPECFYYINMCFELAHSYELWVSLANELPIVLLALLTIDIKRPHLIITLLAGCHH